MTLAEVEVTGHLSITRLRLPRQLTVLTGGKDVGMTNLYRSLELLRAAATGTLAAELVRTARPFGASLAWAGLKTSRNRSAALPF